MRIAAASFDLKKFDERTSLRDFRFTTSEIITNLVPLFVWDKTATAGNRYRFYPLLTTFLVLRHLAYSARREDLTEDFGRLPGQLSEIYWENLDYMLKLRSELVLTWKSDIMQSHAHVYAEYISEKAPLQNFAAFIDSTNMRLSRPGVPNLNQRSLYSGHKSTLCYKFQF